MVAALQCLKLYADKVKDIGQKYGSCNTIVAFIDDELLLGSKPHNRSMFMTNYIREQKANRILVDGGSAVNIIPKSEA